MGTVLELTLIAEDPATARALLDAAFAQVAVLESKLTRFDTASELSRLNAGAGQGPQALSDPLAELLRRAVRYAQLTDGAFDVTIGPLVALWIDAAQADRLPDEAALAAALQRIGAQRLDLTPGRVILPAGFSIDLGGIAKGYALDQIAASWDPETPALLSFGQSSVLARGTPPGSPGWRMALRGAHEELAGVLTLRDQAFSVSSTLGQWSEIGGVRYGHVIDPRSGQALRRAAIASVVATDATLAEALSTALVILEPQRGIEILESLAGCEARIEDEAGEVFETSGWRSVTRFESFPREAP
jgi:thiamine biosynthesis lipoprotein